MVYNTQQNQYLYNILDRFRYYQKNADIGPIPIQIPELV